MDTIERSFTVKPRDRHVEVTGASESEVREAMDLLYAVRKTRRGAYEGLRDSLVVMMAEAKVVSPQISEAAQAAAAHRAALLDTPAFDYGDLASVRGVTPGAVRSWVSRNSERIIAPTFTRRTVLPAFQFSATGELREHIAQVNAVLKADPAMDDWSRWAWWHSRTSFLSGQSPLDALDSTPERVLHAARRMAQPNPA